MLIDFFYTLRAAKLPVSVKEFLALLEALDAGIIGPKSEDRWSLDDFYHLGRTILVKDEKHYDKYDRAFSAYFKGVEMLTLNERNQACLPAQLREHGFSTHYLQGAGLRFMAKDKIMPHIGFDATHGLEWFSNANYLEFPWGKDDKAFFEGALDYPFCGEAIA